MRQNMRNLIKTAPTNHTLFYQEMDKFQMRHKVKMTSLNILFKSHRNDPNDLHTQEIMVPQRERDSVNTGIMTSWYWNALSMGLLPDTQICGCACAGNAGNVFPVTAGKRSRHASRHVRHARAVMHVGIANQRFPLKSAAGENVPGIPGACATCNFPYLVRGPLLYTLWGESANHQLLAKELHFFL